MSVRIAIAISVVRACCAAGLLVPLTTASVSSAPVIGNAAFTTGANQIVERVEREDGFSGVILVASGEAILLRRAAGSSNRELGIPNSAETKFPLASVTKQFTAAAILLLSQDGKLSLTDPISKYYPDVPASLGAASIASLLRHSSGIVDCRCEMTGFLSYQDWIERSAKQPLAFTPDTGFLYSNAGYSILTAIIEKQTGQTYADFLSARIFVPLGMKNTGYGIPAGDVTRGYIRSRASGAAVWEAGLPSRIEATGGFGGLYSTVDDMLLWERALAEGKLLSEASRRAMFTDYGNNYGYGWRFANKFGKDLVWHTGNDPAAGFASVVDRFPAENLTIIVLTNNTGLTESSASLLIGGKTTTFPANAARKAVEDIESLYFTGTSSK